MSLDLDGGLIVIPVVNIVKVLEKEQKLYYYRTRKGVKFLSFVEITDEEQSRVIKKNNKRMRSK